MAKRTITLELLARNKTSKGFKDAGRDAQSMSRALSQAGAVAAAGLAVAGAAAVAFGVSSVKAFAEAEEAQNRLAFAFEKFPALADTSIQALQGLNEALMKKTRFDDDAIASGQAVLAQFGLTGSQLRRLTPLLLDYSTRTGKDMTEAAEDLGRALLGQGRALKILGIDFRDTGSTAGNFDQLVRDLEASVGGLAETAAQTAAGKLEQLQNRFGEVQETIGAALMPALDSLLEWLEGDGLVAVETFAGWLADEAIPAVKGFADEVARMGEDGTLVPSVVAGIGAVTAAQIGLNAAIAANPVGLIIAALIALGAWFIWLGANYETATGWVLDAAENVVIGLANVQMWMNGLTTSFVNNIINMINAVMGPINAVRTALGLPVQVVPAFRIDNSGLQATINGILDGRVLASNAGRQESGTAGNAQRGGAGFFAAGGIVRPTPGGTQAVIGEAGQAEAVIPLSASALARYGLGGGGDEIHIHMPPGSFVGTMDQFAQRTVRAIENAKRSGAVRGGALA